MPGRKELHFNAQGARMWVGGHKHGAELLQRAYRYRGNLELEISLDPLRPDLQPRQAVQVRGCRAYLRIGGGAAMVVKAVRVCRVTAASVLGGVYREGGEGHAHCHEAGASGGRQCERRLESCPSQRERASSVCRM